MKVHKIVPRGYCKGVVHAIQLAKKAREEHPTKPVYILGMLVHNELIAEAFRQIDVITISDKNKSRMELLEMVHDGVVVLTAHGSDAKVKEAALAKGLIVVDATCEDVTRTYDIIREHLSNDYEVLYIGKNKHPEAEGAISIDPSKVHLIETISDIERMDKTKKYLITNQTTMSLWDVYHLMNTAHSILPKIVNIQEICNATQIRQEAVANLPSEIDVVIVVGDPASNNSTKLAEIAISKGNRPAYLVNNCSEIQIEWLQNKQLVGVTAGASTPTYITNQVINYLEQFELENPSTHQNYPIIDMKKVI